MQAERLANDRLRNNPMSLVSAAGLGSGRGQTGNKLMAVDVTVTVSRQRVRTRRHEPDLHRVELECWPQALSAAVCAARKVMRTPGSCPTASRPASTGPADSRRSRSRVT